MTILIFGAPKPYSAQCRDRVLSRSRYGVSMNVAGSTGGKFPVVSGMGGKLRAPRSPAYGLSRADFGARLWTRHNALDRGGRELAAVALAGGDRRVVDLPFPAQLVVGVAAEPVRVHASTWPRPPGGGRPRGDGGDTRRVWRSPAVIAGVSGSSNACASHP